MELEIPKEFYDSIKNVVRYQNTLLLRQISNDYKWDFDSLKKKYLKDKPIKELLNKEEEKKKKKVVVRKKKVVVSKEESSTDTSQEDSTDYDEEFNKTKCYKYIHDNKMFFVDDSNNYCYNKEMEFVGILENEGINFDAEEPE